MGGPETMLSQGEVLWFTQEIKLLATNLVICDFFFSELELKIIEKHLDSMEIYFFCIILFSRDHNTQDPIYYLSNSVF